MPPSQLVSVKVGSLIKVKAILKGWGGGVLVVVVVGRVAKQKCVNCVASAIPS